MSLFLTFSPLSFFCPKLPLYHRLGEGNPGWLGGMVGRVIGVVTGISWWLVGGIGGWGMGGYVGLLVVVSFLYASLPQFVQAECNYNDEDHD